METNGIATIVYPARDLEAGIAAWTALTGTEPLFATPDYAVFKVGDVEFGLTRLPWVDHPLVMLDVPDVEAARAELLGRGVTPMAEQADGSLAELGTAPVTNGDPETGIVDMPGARLAVVKAADGSLIGLRQAVAWG